MVVGGPHFRISEAPIAVDWQLPVRDHLPREMHIYDIDAYFAGLAMQYEDVCGESMGLFTDMERELRIMRPDVGRRFAVSAGEYLKNHPMRPGATMAEVAGGYRNHLGDGRICPIESPTAIRHVLADQIWNAGANMTLKKQNVDTLLSGRAAHLTPFIAAGVRSGRLSEDEGAYTIILKFLAHTNPIYRSFALRLITEVDKDTLSETYLSLSTRLKLFLFLFEQMRSTKVPPEIKGVWWNAVSRVIAVANTRSLNGVRLYYLEKVFGEMLIFLDAVEVGKKEFKKSALGGRRRGPKILPIELRMKEVLERDLAIIENPHYAEFMDFAAEFFRSDIESAIELCNSLISKEEQKKRSTPPKGSGAPPAPVTPETLTGGTSGGVPPPAQNTSTVTGLIETGETSGGHGYVADESLVETRNAQRAGVHLFRPQIRSRIPVQNLGARVFVGAPAARILTPAMP